MADPPTRWYQFKYRELGRGTFEVILLQHLKGDVIGTIHTYDKTEDGTTKYGAWFPAQPPSYIPRVEMASTMEEAAEHLRQDFITREDR